MRLAVQRKIAPESTVFMFLAGRGKQLPILFNVKKTAARLPFSNTFRYVDAVTKTDLQRQLQVSAKRLCPRSYHLYH
jgi:hypothetical protein